MTLGFEDVRVFVARLRSVVSRRLGRHDEDRVLALLGLVQLQQSGVLRRLPFDLQPVSQPVSSSSPKTNKHTLRRLFPVIRQEVNKSSQTISQAFTGGQAFEWGER